MTLKVSIKGFRLIRPVARKTNCKVRIVSKRGLPFIINRYRKRKAFVFGAFIFFALIVYLSSFIWSVEIIGNQKLETDFLLGKLALLGVKPGALKYGIDTDNAVNIMMIEVKELGWMSIVLKGTKVKVEVSERREPPPVVPKETPCNIVARRDGVISTIIVKAGQEKVKEGDTVTEGQVLISGIIENKNPEEAPLKTHALGNVKARTWYEKTGQVNIKALENERTGRYKDHYSLSILGKKISFLKKSIKYENHDRVEIKKRLSIGENFVLPFELIIDRIYETNIVEKEIDLEEAKSITADRVYNEILKELAEDSEIVKTDVNFIQKDNNEFEIVVTMECIEEIGITTEIGVTQEIGGE